MLKFLRLANSILHRPPRVFAQVQNISVSAVQRLKEIHETREGNTLIVEGVTVPSLREPYMVTTPFDDKGPCPVCRLGLDVKHTDVLILSQFVRSDGCMLPRRITGLCKTQQKRISTMVTMAHKAGLMPNLTPSYSKKDPSKRYKWKQFNCYFDESTIGKKIKEKRLRY